MEQTLVTRTGAAVSFEVNQSKIGKILQLKEEMGDRFPKFAIFVISYNAEDHIEKTIARVPKELEPVIDEIYIFDDFSTDQTVEVAHRIKEQSFWKDKLSIFKNPTNLGYGGNQKNGYRYAIKKGHDFVVMLHGDGQYAPEFLPDLILPTIESGKQVVFGSRMINGKDAIKGGMPYYKYLGNRVLTQFENFILGTKLHEFHSGYRLYSTKVLKSIPFAENTNEFHFDSQIIIQCRALGVDIHEVPIKTYYGDEECRVDGIKYAKDVCRSVLEYRLHQLHIIRRGNYLVGGEFRYTRKNSPYSSHERILSLIKGPGKVLDLGSSNGLLAQSLKEKGVETVCVDMEDPDKISPEIETYHQVNLENLDELKQLNLQREFDVIILADVVEHVRNAEQLLNHVQRYLKKDGELIISVPNIAIWIYRISLLIGRFNYGPKGTLDETHVKLYTQFSIRQLIERSGYQIQNELSTGLPFEVVFESIGKSRILGTIDKVYGLLADFWARMFAYQFVMVGKIRSYQAEEGEGKL